MQMVSAPAPADEEAGVRPIVVLLSILSFWLLFGLVITLRALILDFPAQGEMAWRRMVVSALGIVVTWLLYLALRRFDDRRLPLRVGAAFALSLPAALAIAATNYYMFNVYDPLSLLQDPADSLFKDHELSVAAELAESVLQRYFFLMAWAALYLALSYAARVRLVERRAARLEQAAQQAELRSLRYQVNPHFLFNTLNSLSSLVMAGRREEAETMIMNLAQFYRASLTGDPLEDVPLREEVELQRLYLAIEGARFPDRLRTTIAIPEALQGFCVPGLILQPLVENAIKHGVSRTSRPVTITIGARADGGTLELCVRDDADPDPTAHDAGGTGIGLANVRDRLQARFGEAASLVTRAEAAGGYAVTLRLPVIAADC